MFYKDEKGYTLAIMFIFIAVFVLLTAVIASVVISENKMSVKHYSEQQAYYLARSGAEYAISNVDIYKNLSSGGKTAFEIGSLDESNIDHDEITGINNFYELPGENEVEVFVERTGSQYIISSSGNFKDENANIVLTLEIESSALPPLDYALFAAGSGDDLIDMRGSTSIVGDVGTNGNSFDAFEFKGTAGIDGDFWLNTEEPSPPGDYSEEPRHPDWSNSKSYNGGEKVHYDGLHYEASNWTSGDTPGENPVWQVILPENQTLEWFDTQIYDDGDKVFYDGLYYEAKYWTQGDLPGESDAWKAPIENLTGNVGYLDNPLDYPIPVMPDFPDPDSKSDININGNTNGMINDDGSYDKISIKGNNNLVIDRNGGDRIIRVKDFDIKQGHISFENPDADGTLKIYIEDKFTFKGDSSINTPDSGTDALPDNVEIYYAGSSSPDLGGNVVLNANLFIDKADFDIGGSNSTYGYIFSGGSNINIRGAADVSTIYAPNAHISMRGLGNSDSVLEGAVIANTFSARGAAEINYRKPDSEKMPEGFLTSLSGSEGSSEPRAKVISWSRD